MRTGGFGVLGERAQLPLDRRLARGPRLGEHCGGDSYGNGARDSLHFVSPQPGMSENVALWTRSGTKLLGNAVLRTHEGYGHTFAEDPSMCVDEAMTEYLVDLITPPPGTVCQSDQQPFDPEFR